MKKISILILLTEIIFTPATFAYISGKKITKENLLYCPSEIVCSEDNRLDFCKYQDSLNFDYLLPYMKPPFERTFPKGKYILYHITAPYRSSDTEVECIYKFIDNNGKMYGLILTSKIEANLEAYINETTSWKIDVNKQAECAQLSAFTECPLKQRSALVIHNKNLPNGIYASVSGVKISDQIDIYKYTHLIYDYALVGCGDIPECKIDIVSSKGGCYGSVTISMDDKMKIQKIETTRASETQINQITPYNAVEVSYPSYKNFN